MSANPLNSLALSCCACMYAQEDARAAQRKRRLGLLAASEARRGGRRKPRDKPRVRPSGSSDPTLYLDMDSDGEDDENDDDDRAAAGGGGSDEKGRARQGSMPKFWYEMRSSARHRELEAAPFKSYCGYLRSDVDPEWKAEEA